jgi:hypothetical protein
MWEKEKEEKKDEKGQEGAHLTLTENNYRKWNSNFWKLERF